jgi:hypothetical protein
MEKKALQLLQPEVSLINHTRIVNCPFFISVPMRKQGHQLLIAESVADCVAPSASSLK